MVNRDVLEVKIVLEAETVVIEVETVMRGVLETTVLSLEPKQH